MGGYGTVAVGVSILLFVVPSRDSGFKSGILDWRALDSFPWDILILLGGGYALAKGFSVTRLRYACSHVLCRYSNHQPISQPATDRQWLVVN
jgi:di/tricarboxylate transporter